MQKIFAVASLCGAIAFLHPGEAGAQEPVIEMPLA
jgi:hypothetical protein